ncbi:type I secretion system permease/ATPase [Brucella intermedia]|uniref:type I secretion system permease/ATPase n=1 Tax=Brucella intermedia TaxID=94625 RepID=UPI001E61E5D2|nr:type I secretion system permease/ATPase [Brucella intermedia]MCB4920791.1 type I secretion system permease/ATPase [Brucella intermedia]
MQNDRFAVRCGGYVKGVDLRLVHWRDVIDIGVFSFIVNVLLLTSPLFMLQVYDRVLPTANSSTLLYLSIIAILALCCLSFLDVVRSLYAQRIATGIDKKLGEAAFRTSLDGKHADAPDIQPLRNLGKVRTFIASKGLQNLFDLPFAPLFLIVLYFIHPVLCWLTAGGAIVLVAIALANQISLSWLNEQNAEQATISNLVAQTFVQNKDTVRSMGMERHVARVWGKAFATSLIVQNRAASINTCFGGLSRFVRILLQMATLAVGAWLVLQNQMTAGMIFASSLISGRALQPLDQLIGGWKQTFDAFKAWEQLQASLLPYSKDATKKVLLPDPKGATSVRNLVYTRPGTGSETEAIIKGVSFDIRAGERIALIGPSRAGKSSLARLLVGASVPTSGSICVDGADRKSWDRDQIGETIGYLAQDVQLLPGTIAENIARFNPGATDDSIVSAASRSQAHKLILSLNNGYQTRICNASVLSGGERQRIGLARAFYGNPRILVLDEPNANLDSEGETSLERALLDARERGTTVIIITHRMSIAATCDRVLALREGTIASFGPPEEVLRMPPREIKGSPPSSPKEPLARFTTSWRTHPISRGRDND